MLFITLLILLIFVAVLPYRRMMSYDLVYVTSDLDGRSYLVRNGESKEESANMIAKLIRFLEKLEVHLSKERPEYAEKLRVLLYNLNISENGKMEPGTSYSLNKGEQIVICMRDTNGVIHDYNILVYVLLHEISHVFCDEYGHTKKFKRIFKDVTEISIKHGLYQKVDYDVTPQSYCGINIIESIV